MEKEKEEQKQTPAKGCLVKLVTLALIALGLLLIHEPEVDALIILLAIILAGVIIIRFLRKEIFPYL